MKGAAGRIKHNAEELEGLKFKSLGDGNAPGQRSLPAGWRKKLLLRCEEGLSKLTGGGLRDLKDSEMSFTASAMVLLVRVGGFEPEFGDDVYRR